MKVNNLRNTRYDTNIQIYNEMLNLAVHAVTLKFEPIQLSTYTTVAPSQNRFGASSWVLFLVRTVHTNIIWTPWFVAAKYSHADRNSFPAWHISMRAARTFREVTIPRLFVCFSYWRVISEGSGHRHIHLTSGIPPALAVLSCSIQKKFEHK